MNDHPREELLKSADALARENLSDARYGHTLRVAQTAEHLAELYGVEARSARLAALVHDAARELPKAEYLRLAEQWNIPIGAEEHENPKLLHGAVAAEISRRELGVEDEEVLQAVREHTVGAAGMTNLSLVLYLADKIEPARKYPSVAEIRKTAGRSLIAATTEALRRSIAYNDERGKPTHPESLRAMKWLQENR